MPDEALSLRETLESNVEAAEAGVLETPVDRPRDETGRFTRKDEALADSKAQMEMVTKVATAKIEHEAQQPAPQAPQARPITTWKKEYLPLWDKLSSGQPLTPEEAKKLADYSVQRENEFKGGVSTYKAEAMQAKELQEAIAPFIPELQMNGMKVPDWIRMAGQTHYALARGTPQQKLQVFQTLAQQYGVPIAAIQQVPAQGGIPPVLSEFMQQIAELRQQVNGVNSWRQQTEQERQQQQVQQLQSQVEQFAADAEHYPHFERLREPMAQLLESGAARDLGTAYRMAERMDDELFNEKLNQALEEQRQTQAQTVSKAKGKAISPRSSTPRGEATTASNPQDRRATIEGAYDSIAGGGRV